MRGNYRLLQLLCQEQNEVDHLSSRPSSRPARPSCSPSRPNTPSFRVWQVARAATASLPAAVKAKMPQVRPEQSGVRSSGPAGEMQGQHVGTWEAPWQAQALKLLGAPQTACQGAPAAAPGHQPVAGVPPQGPGELATARSRRQPSLGTCPPGCRSPPATAGACPLHTAGAVPCAPPRRATTSTSTASAMGGGWIMRSARASARRALCTRRQSLPARRWVSRCARWQP